MMIEAVTISCDNLVRFRAGAVRAACLGSLTALGLGLGGCAVFPAPGPNAQDVVSLPSRNPQGGYALVPVTPAVLSSLSSTPHGGFTATFANQAPVQSMILGIGDTVSITIWDMGGVFAPVNAQSAGSPPQNTLQLTPGAALPAAPNPTPTASGMTLPAQLVDQVGDVTVPYAGRVRAVGLTTWKLQQEIASAMRKMTFQPQVLVTVSQSENNLVNVSGDVVHPNRIALPLNGLRILDAIAISGGSNAPSSDMMVRLTRKQVTHSTRLEEVVRFPAENIYLESGDLLYLDKVPQSVVVLGATNHNAQVLFGKPELDLAEAVGNGGGLADIQADPYGVFVFRYEPASIARALGLNSVDPASPNTPVPVIYQVDMKRPEGFFMAQAFQMRDHDLVYVANSDTVQLDKMFRMFSIISSIPKSGTVVSP